MEEKVLEILAELCADDIVKEDRDIDILEEGNQNRLFATDNPFALRLLEKGKKSPAGNSA